MVLPVGMYHLNDNPSLNFQLNRLVNMDMGDLDKVRKVGGKIKDVKSWKEVLMKSTDDEYSAGDRKSAMGFYRMAEFYMDWRDPDALKCWKKARKIFFEYFEDFFKAANQMPEIEKWLSLMSDAREDVDKGVLVNLIKCIYGMREVRANLVQESLDDTIEFMLVQIEDFVVKKPS